MNPYWGKNFFTFYSVFFKRLFTFSYQEIAPDEVQIFVLSFVAIASAILGVFLVLKKMSMLANSLSHTILLGIILAFIGVGSLSDEPVFTFKILFIGALISALITTLFTQILTHVVGLQEDASIGLVFTTLFAFSIVLVTGLTRSSHIGLEAVMGNVDALHISDLKLISGVALLNVVIFTLLFKEFKLTTFDSTFASALGFSPRLFSYIIMILTARTSIGAFRSVGVLLVLSFLVGPPLCARLLTHNLKKLLLLAILIGILCSMVGVALSRHVLSIYHAPLSTAGIISTLIALSYFLCLGIKKMQACKIRGIVLFCVL